MSCDAPTVHDGHEHRCTIVPAPHPAEIDHMAPCGKGRLHRWRNEMTTTDANKVVCADTPASSVPAAVRAVNRALDAGWTTQLDGDSTTVTLTVQRAGARESGVIVWKMNDDGEWRFLSCVIDGKRYGARQIAERLAQPAPPAPQCPNGCVAWCGGQVCQLTPAEPGANPGALPPGEGDVPRTIVAVDPGVPTGLATVTPIRPAEPLATVHPLPVPVAASLAAVLAPSPNAVPVGIVVAPAVIPGTGGGPVMPTGNLASFMSAAPRATPVNGNTAWATAYAAELREIIEWHGNHSPRNLQVTLGPSELGVPCDRQVAGKMAQVPETNHVVDPWPSIMGTAGHAWMDKAFKAENERHGLRWVPEQQVTPHVDHPGTSDLYDGFWQAVVDWKFLGQDKIEDIARKGPSVQYRVQLLLYGKGYRNLGLPVRRVVLVALPRTKSTLDGMYVWDHELTEEDDKIIEEVFTLTAIRKQWAEEIRNGHIGLHNVPATPDADTCYFCPFYRPQAAHDGGPGCPGTVTN